MRKINPRIIGIMLLILSILTASLVGVGKVAGEVTMYTDHEETGI